MSASPNQLLTQFAADFNNFRTEFSDFTDLFEDFVDAFTQSQGQGNVKGKGGGGGGGEGGPSLMGQLKNAGKMYASQFYGELQGAINQFADIQKRAFASNISLQQIQVNKNLGVGIAALSEEILAFREEGVRNLTDSTMNLIQRMKLTGQSTESLRKFVGQNSVTLLLSSKQAQSLAGSIAETATQFGMRQDQLIDFANQLSKNLDVQSFLGFGDKLVAAGTELKAALGGRGDEAAAKMMQFISNPDNMAAIINLGLQPFVDQLATATGDERIRLMQEMAKTADATLQAQAGQSKSMGITQGQYAAKAMLQAYGGEQALVFSQVTKLFEESNTRQKEQVDVTAGLGALLEAIKVPLQNLAKSINEFLVENPMLVKIIGKTIGYLIPILAVVGAIVAFFSFGWIPVLITAIVAGIAGFFGYKNAKEEQRQATLDRIEENTRKENKYEFRKDDTAGFGLMGAINDTLFNIVSNKDNRDRNLEITEKMLVEMKLLNRTMLTGDGRPEMTRTNQLMK